MALTPHLVLPFLGNCPVVILSSLKMVTLLIVEEPRPHLPTAQSTPLAHKDSILLGLGETKLWAWSILSIRNKTLFS